MIRRVEGAITWVIQQGAHAWISGQIAEHWTGCGAGTLHPRADLMLAAHTHDVGWTVPDSQPRCNTLGQPRTFTEMDLDEHFTIWEASIAGVFAQSRYAALLTSLHCSALYGMRLRFVEDSPADQDAIRAFMARRKTWETDLIAEFANHPYYSTAATEAALAENLRLLQVWDYLSLLLCMSTVAEQPLEDVPLHNGDRVTLQLAPGGRRSLMLDPYPLDSPLTLWIEARRVLEPSFASDADLQAALAEAPYQPLAFELHPF